MKPIKITAENAADIAAALAAVNGRSNAHTFTTFTAVQVLADGTETQLSKLGLSKAQRGGAKAIYESGDVLPSSYKYAATTTMVTLVRRAAGWYLTEVRASKLHPKSKPYSALLLTPSQDAVAVAVLRKGYMIQGGAPYLTAVAS